MVKGLSDRLREARRWSGLSQKEVADRIGLSKSIISSYETGDRTPSAENLLALSYLYKCSTDYLLGRTDSPLSVSAETIGLTPEQVQLVRQLLQSSADTSGTVR